MKAAPVASWLARRTFHHRDFGDAAKLLKAKERAGLTVSLCLPALNEEETVGEVVSCLKGALMDDVPLLDEIAVIDSGSTDGTVARAARAGAATHFSGDILPDQGFHPGKGENLWKAVHQLRGDLICFVDSDIRNIHPRFITGLLGPLLTDASIQFVKGYYHRPAGEGRVTEILARPLFSLLHPELTALAQPLSGEYAARRSLLETLSFPVGYAVETAHLIDIHRSHGLDALAQTDLETRVHRHHDEERLGAMAFEILGAVLGRQEEREFPDELRQFDLGGEFPVPTVRRVNTAERPPLITLPAYRARHGR